MMKKEIKVIITGTTGMVGEGVLFECLNHPDVSEILVINRRSCGYIHNKLKEILHDNFFDLTPIQNELKGYNACYFCLGVSSVGMSNEDYYQKTYVLTMNVAKTLCDLNEGMTFCYVSGSGTYSDEHGLLHWARVKGKTENHLAKLPFEQVYHFRPGIIKPTKGLKYTHKAYHLFGWLFPILKMINKNSYVTLREVGLAMIHTMRTTNERRVLEVKDIKKLAN